MSKFKDFKEFINKHNFTISNIIVHIIIISIFIITLFFTYGVYIEKKILEKQIDIFVTENLENIKVLTPDLANSIKNKVNDLKFGDMSEEDKIVEESNNEMLKKTIKMGLIGLSVFLFLLLLIYIFFVPKGTKLNFTKELIKHNFLSLLFVAAVEIIFLTFFLGDYHYINTNKIKKEALTTINTLINTKLNKSNSN